MEINKISGRWTSKTKHRKLKGLVVSSLVAVIISDNRVAGDFAAEKNKTENKDRPNWVRFINNEQTSKEPHSGVDQGVFKGRWLVSWREGWVNTLFTLGF